MSYLVTGASGFLGRHLLQALRQARPEVPITVLVRGAEEWASYEWAQTLQPVRVLEGELTRPEQWCDSPKLADVEGIFHLAALVRHSRRQTDEVFRVNVDGTRGMVELAAQHRCRMLFVSTSGTVGCSRHKASGADEEAPFAEAAVGAWPYYRSKIQAEQAARALARAHHVDLVIVRPPVLLGPGDHRYRSTGQVIRFLRGGLPFLVRGGIHFVDIRDAARAMVAAMLHPRPRPVYHLQGTACSIDAFFAELGQVSGKRSPRLHLPYGLALGLARADEWLGMRLRGRPLALLPDPVVIEMAHHHWDLESRYSETDLNFRPRAGRETLADTVRWLREQGVEAGAAAH